jgi:uncharacterized protein YbjT (DUF2867 family)
MTIIVTGATGGIGSTTLRTFHALGLPKSSYCGTSRNLSTVSPELREISNWRECTYDDPASMDKAFEGCTKVKPNSFLYPFFFWKNFSNTW